MRYSWYPWKEDVCIKIITTASISDSILVLLTDFPVECDRETISKIQVFRIILILSSSVSGMTRHANVEWEMYSYVVFATHLYVGFVTRLYAGFVTHSHTHLPWVGAVAVGVSSATLALLWPSICKVSRESHIHMWGTWLTHTHTWSAQWQCVGQMRDSQYYVTASICKVGRRTRYIYMYTCICIYIYIYT